MINWFEIFADRLTAIEEGQKEILALLSHSTTSTDTNPYGSFQWLCDTCSNVPPSTLRIKSAAGDIPGVIKFGKRVLYEKAVVLNWLRSQTRQPVEYAFAEHRADEQISRQLNKKGGVV